MSYTHPQLFIHSGQPRAILRRALPLALVAIGALLVGHAFYLGLHRPGFLGGVAYGQFLPGFQFLLGLVLASTGLLGRRDETTPVLVTLAGIGALVMVTGPATPLSLGLIQWTVLSSVTLVCVAIPAVLLAALGHHRSIGLELPPLSP